MPASLPRSKGKAVSRFPQVRPGSTYPFFPLDPRSRRRRAGLSATEDPRWAKRDVATVDAEGILPATRTSPPCSTSEALSEPKSMKLHELAGLEP